MEGRRHVALGRLADLSSEDLKAEWARRYGAPAPGLSPDLLRLGLGYRLQEQKLGGVSRSTRTLLRRVAVKAGEGDHDKPIPRKLTPGTRLVRDWHGVGHTVIVLQDGFEYEGKCWKSLTAIALAITGTHWNGPRFFGITGRGKP
jgi:Protein of unknown function (DUF2924)